MAFVYDAVDGDVGKKLREINPDPHFQQNHHQWLKDFGRQKIHDQIERVVTIMKLCDDMDDFRRKFARVFKKSAIAGQMTSIGIRREAPPRRLTRLRTRRLYRVSDSRHSV